MSFFAGAVIPGGSPPAFVPAVPALTAPPVLSGTPVVGGTLSLSTGSWTGSPTAFERRYFRDGLVIPGETGATLALTAADVGRRIEGEVVARNASGAGLPARSALVGPVAAPPVHTSPPAIVGVPRVGLTVSARPGVILGVPEPAVTYQWRRGASDIPGATAALYTLAPADLGALVSCRLTATNSAGASSADTAQIGPVTDGVPAPADPPVNTALPTVSGTVTVGETLTATTGTWTGTAPITYAWQWQRGPSASGPWTDITGATASTYTLVAADDGQHIRVRVTASNVAGSASAHSASVGPVGASIPTEQMLARRSVKFHATNGFDGLTAFQLNGTIRPFRNSANTAFEVQSWFCRMHLPPGAVRTYVTGLGSANAQYPNSSSNQILGIGNNNDGAFTWSLHGVQETPTSDSGRLRINLIASGPTVRTLRSGRLWQDTDDRTWLDVPSDDFMVFLETDGTDLWIDVIRPDGTVVAGQRVAVSGFSGVGATNPWLGGANPGNAFNGFKDGGISDFGMIRRQLTPTERLRLARGEEVAAVLGTGFSGFHYRLSGVGDLTVTNGTENPGNLSIVTTGIGNTGEVAPMSCRTIGGAHDGTHGLMVGGSLWHGLVFGKNRATGAGRFRIPVTNTGTVATHYEARVMTWRPNGANPDTTVTPWTRITTAPVAPGASVIGQLDHVAGPWRQIEVRPEAQPMLRVATAVCGIGTVVGFHGQSELQFGLYPTSMDNGSVRQPHCGQASDNRASIVRVMSLANRFDLPPRVRCERFRALGYNANWGGMALAREWARVVPDEPLMMLDFTYAGSSRTLYTNNSNISSFEFPTGSGNFRTYRYFGTLDQSETGLVASVLAAAWPDATEWPITGHLYYPGPAESAVLSDFISHVRAYFYGEGGPQRSFASVQARNPHPGVWMAVRHARPGAANSNNATAESNRAFWVTRNNNTSALLADPVPSGWTVLDGGVNNIVAYTSSDSIHPANVVAGSAGNLSGNARFFANFIFPVLVLANRHGGWNPATLALPATATRASDTSLTIALPTPPAGAIWRRRSGSGSLNRVFELSTDGGATWRCVTSSPVSAARDVNGTATISSGVLTISAAALSGVPNSQVRVRYDNPMQVTGTGTDPMEASPTAAQTAEADMHLALPVAAVAPFDSVEWVGGVPLRDFSTVLTVV